jgi:ferric-dicitrate binding protein FerR (iron transport regulator)
MLQSSARSGVSILLCSMLLLPALLLAGGSSPLGTLRSDGAVFVGSTQARLETPVFSGDQVTTAEGRATLSLARGNRIMFDPGSNAGLWRSDEGITVGLAKGRLVFTADPKSPLRVDADGLALAPAGSFPSLAEVAMRSDGTLSLSVHRGSVAVRNLRAETVVVPAGKFITIAPRLAQQPGGKSEPIGTGAHGKMTLGEKLRTFRIGNLSHAASAAIVYGAIGGAVAAAIIIPQVVGEEEASPSTP